MAIYLDNAATTKMDDVVLKTMLPWLSHQYGNPSSIYSLGREAKLKIELCRKTIAGLMGCKIGEIFFTSSGTESTNMALLGAVKDIGCKRIITSQVEHAATLNCVIHLQKHYDIDIQYLPVDEKGRYDLKQLEVLLSKNNTKTLVSLLHIHNEIGNIYPIKSISELCKKYDAIFHVDAVQSAGGYNINLEDLHIHFMSCSAHKFHGPKGCGFLYINNRYKISPLFFGGNQERNMRSGTEGVAQIVGLTQALENELLHRNKNERYILGIKTYCIKQLQTNFPNIYFNGDVDNSSYKIVNIGFKKNEKTEMLVIHLDTYGICVSSGSACSSGTNMGSHLSSYLNPKTDLSNIRVSFSKYNNKEDIDIFVETLKKCL